MPLALRSLYACRAKLSLSATLIIVLSATIAPAARSQTAHAGGTVSEGQGWNHPAGMAADVHGNIFVANSGAGTIQEIIAVNGIIPASNPTVLTVAGGFSEPSGVAVDVNGNVFVANSDDDSIKEIVAVNGTIPASNPTILTVAGGFAYPYGVAVDANGNVFVANSDDNTVKEIVAVNGTIPASNPTILTVGSGFAYPYGVAMDSSGNLFVADTGNKAVKEIVAVNGTISASNPTILTLGSGFSYLSGVAVDPSGNIYVADTFNNAVKEIVAVNGTNPASNPTILTLATGQGSPFGIALDLNGNVLFADNSGDNTVKEIARSTVKFPAAAVGSPSGTLESIFTFDSPGTLASTPYVVLTQGAQKLDFQAAAAQPATQCVSGNSYNAGDSCTVDVTFTPTHPGSRIGAVQLMGSAGLPIATFNLNGIGAGPMVTFPGNANPITLPSGSGFAHPGGLAVDGSGNVYVADTHNNAVKEIVAVNGAVSAGSSVVQLPGNFKDPFGLAVDGSGNVYVADTYNNAVKEIVAVNGAVFAGSSVVQLPGNFYYPYGVAVDGNGNVYVADTGHDAMTEIVAVNGVVSAGSSILQLPSGAGFNIPYDLAVDSMGNVYVADTNNNAIKEIVAVNGAVSAGSSVVTLSSAFSHPFYVTVDGMGNVYVADTFNNAVKEIVAVNGAVSANSNIVTLPTSFSSPAGVAVDGNGNVYVTSLDAVQVLPFATPPSLSFATTAAGSTSTDSPQTVTVSNNGNAPLAFYVPAAGGNPAFTTQNFPLADGAVTTCPQLSSSGANSAVTLAAGASCTYGFQFNPQVVGTLTDSAILYDNSLNLIPATQSISLNGVATGSNIPGPVVSTIKASSTVLAVGGNATVTVHLSNGVYGIQGQAVSVYTNPPSASVAYPSGYSGVSDSNGNFILSVTDTSAETIHLLSTVTGGRANVTFVEPSYLVTTLTDDATGNAGNCVALATDNSGGNAACSLRDAIAAANALPAGVTATINFASSLTSGATQASPAVYAISGSNAPTGGGSLVVTGSTNIVVNGPTSGTGSTLVNLLAIDGGGMSGRVLNIYRGIGTTAVNNLIVRNGGGININGGTVTLTSSTLSGNSASSGGGLFVGGSGAVTVNGSTFSGNSAQSGGGICASAGTITVANSTFYNNSTYNGDGGAIYIGGGTVTVTNSTFTSNSASDSGGGIFNASVVTVTNSTFSGNSAPKGGGLDLYGSATLYNNFVADPILNSYTDGGGNITNGTALNLSALGNYGGSTQTMVPLPGSPAICGGLATIPSATIPTTDQRGATHSSAYCAAGSIDAGAVQTSYSLGTAFTTQPPSVAPAGLAITPNPAVTVTENGVAFGGAAVTMSAATGAIGGTTSATSVATTGLAAFNNLTVTGAQPGDDLVATLSMNPALSPAVSLTLTSTTFSSMTLSPPATLTGQAGVVYSQSVAVSNGTSPYTYTVTSSGALPGGLSLNPSTGAITGTPTVVGSFPVTVQVTDANKATASTTFTLTTSAPTLTLLPLSVSLSVGTPVSIQFQAGGGTPLYGYTSATLPLGLKLSASGLLSGTPTAAASFNFSVTVTDSTTGTGSPFSSAQPYSGTTSKSNTPVSFTAATLTQTYKSSPLSPAAVTTPTGLTVSYSYVGTGATSYPTSTTPPTNAGTYSVTATVNDSNYGGTSLPAVFTITKAAATVTPNAATKVFGTSDPTFSSSLSGFFAADGVTAAYTRTPGQTVAGSPYAISATLNPSAALANYSVTYHTAGFTITKATPTITKAPTATAITYGQALASSTLSGGIASTAGVFAWTTPALAPCAGPQSNPVTFLPGDAADYNTATTHVTVTVNPAKPAITFTVPNHIFGDAPFPVSATSPSKGAFTYSVVTGPATISGSTVTLTGEGAVVLKASQVASWDYLAGSGQATFTVATPVTLKLSSTTLVYPLPPAVVIGIGLNNKVVPTGTATVYDGKTAVGTYPVLALGGGNALGLVLPPLAVGKHVLTAVYSGDKNFPAGTSSPVTLTVTPGPVSLSLTCGSLSLKGGQSTSFTVLATEGKLPVPGTVSYTLTGGASGAAVLSNGKAVVTITPPVGADVLTVTFAAQGNYQAASVATTIRVTK